MTHHQNGSQQCTLANRTAVLLAHRTNQRGTDNAVNLQKRWIIRFDVHIQTRIPKFKSYLPSFSSLCRIWPDRAWETIEKLANQDRR